MNSMICCQSVGDDFDIEVQVTSDQSVSDLELDEDRFSIYIGAYEFDGPYNSPDQIAESAGVYAVLCFYDKQYELLDIGYSTNLRHALVNHKDHDDWMEHCTGSLLAAVHYDSQMNEDDAQRMIDAIERELSLTAA